MEILGGLLMTFGGAMLLQAVRYGEIRLPAPLEPELTIAFPLDPALPPEMAELLGRID